MTPLDEDARDLSDYARTGNRDALGRLAQRHVNLVYGVARREVGDAHLAEDVTQAVFIVLCSKAHRITPQALSSWLFVTTRQICANARRTGARRAFHERRAATMKPETAMSSDPHADNELIWSQINQAMGAQRESDRRVLLMRYVDGLEISQISQMLEISELSARKRIQRAVERLREILAQRGVIASSLAVATALPGVAEAAPAALSAAIASSSAAATSGTAAVLAKSMIVWSQLQAAAVVVISMGLVTAVAAGVWRIAVRQIPAVPTLAIANPATAPTSAPLETVSYSGTVTDPDGKPLAGARVWSELSTADPDQARAVEAEGITDAQGRYTLSGLPPTESFTNTGRYDRFERIIHFDHPSYAVAWANVRRAANYSSPDDAAMALSARLERISQIRVAAVDADAKPVVGAAVVLSLQGTTPVSNGGVWYKYLTIPSEGAKPVLTDAQGIATFDRIGASVRAQVVVTANGFARFESRERSNREIYLIRAAGNPFIAALRAGGEIRLRPPPAGPALPRRSEVLALPIGKYSMPAISNWVTTDLEGSYLLSGLEAGSYELIINPFSATNADGVWTVSSTVLLDAKQIGEAVSERNAGAIISGRAVDENGLAVEGHWFRLRRMLRDRQVSFDRVSTTADGRFQFRAQSGDYVLESEDYKPTGRTMQIHVPADSSGRSVYNQDVQVIPFPTVRGRLVDASSKPIAGRVFVDDQAVDTASDGVFSFKPSREVGQRLYAASRDGVLGAAVPLNENFMTLKPARADDVLPTIPLRALGTIRGKLMNSKSEPILDGSVQTNVRGSSVTMIAGWMKLTRDGGSFAISGIPSGIPIHFAASCEQGGATLEFDPLAPGEMRDLGQVILQYNGVPGARWAVSDPNSASVLRGTVVDTEGNPILGATVENVPSAGATTAGRTDTTDQNGMFMLNGVPLDQRLVLLAQAQGFGRTQANVDPRDSKIVIRMAPSAAALFGKPAPEPQVRQWISDPVRLADLRGKVVLLHIGVETRGGMYADTYRDIVRAANKFENRGFAVVLIHRPLNVGRGGGAASRGRVEELPLPMQFPMALDNSGATNIGEIHYNGTTARLYGVEAAPWIGADMILIDKQGLVRAVPNASNLDGWIEKLLAE